MKRQPQTESGRNPISAHRPVPAAKPSASPGTQTGRSHTGLNVEEVNRMIAIAAYLRAQERGFQPGHELEDWVAAEREVRDRLAAARSGGLQ